MQTSAHNCQAENIDASGSAALHTSRNPADQRAGVFPLPEVDRPSSAAGCDGRI